MKLFITNWKMNLSIAHQIELTKKYSSLEKITPHKIIICPSFSALTPISSLVHKTMIALGAQTCSPHNHGAFTGQVSAQNLFELGCSYVLVGHSEERISFHLSEEHILEQIMRIIENGMIPILCIGESLQDYQSGKTVAVLENQLSLLHATLPLSMLYIAYEPLWAIGTQKTPTKDIIEELFARLKLYMPRSALLYGGSVNKKLVDEFITIPHLSGFLLGNASLDFQEFKNIVS